MARPPAPSRHDLRQPAQEEPARPAYHRLSGFTEPARHWPKRVPFARCLPRLSILRGFYRFYLHRCLPLLGSFLTWQQKAYDYLGESIEEFPSGQTMLQLMQANGFGNAIAEPLSGGIVTIYTADK